MRRSLEGEVSRKSDSDPDSSDSSILLQSQNTGQCLRWKMSTAKSLRWDNRFGVISALVGFTLLVLHSHQANALDSRSQLLLELGLSSAPGLSNGLLMRWPSKPTVTIHLLAPSTAAEKEMTLLAAQSVQADCECVASIRVADANEYPEFRENDILFLVDKGGYANFLQLTGLDLSWAYQNREEVEAKFPASKPGVNLKAKYLIEGKALTRSIAIGFFDDEERSLSTIIFDGIVAGAAPTLSRDPKLYFSVVEKVETTEGNKRQISARGREFFRALFDSRVHPGMSREEIVNIRW